jgi:hypothetical protein
MNMSLTIKTLCWIAGGLGLIGGIGLPVGLCFLFGTAVQRRLALTAVWISAGLLAAGAIVLYLVFFYFGGRI